MQIDPNANVAAFTFFLVGVHVALTIVWFALVAYAFSSDAARRFVASSRHVIERCIGAALVALGVGLAMASIKRA